MKLPSPKLREIPPCPAAGEGNHKWLMEAGWALRFNGETAEAAGRYLADKMKRKPDPGEIEDAIAKVYDADVIIGDTDSGWTPPAPKWPGALREAIETVTASGHGMVDLWESSPVRQDEDTASPGALLDALFPGDPLLCVGHTAFDFFTASLSTFATAADAFAQIVPSPMTAKHGMTKEGRQSQHTLEATGSRRFLVIEGDKLDGEPIPKDTQAAVLMHLAQSAPLALVVDSGGKSLHGWFFVAGKTDEQLTPFFRRACSLGADPALWTRSQFARMPGGTRDNGNPQPVLFFNPSAIRP